jgi:hypothetical protein
MACMDKPNEVGDCFVVLSTDGLYWDGEQWVGDWRAARQFATPPLADPWLACERLCVKLRASLGCRCDPAYIASPEVRLTKVPAAVTADVATRNDEVSALPPV